MGTLGQFIKQEISDKLGCNFYCGIPEDEQCKFEFADMTQVPAPHTLCFDVLPAMCGAGDPTVRGILKLLLSKDSKSALMRPVLSEAMPAFTNTTQGRATEICSSGCFTNARSMAMVNACLANGGALGGIRLMSKDACDALMALPKLGYDSAIFLESEFTQGGICKLSERMKSDMLNAEVPKLMNGFYGWWGWGGSLSVVHPEQKVSVAYAMNGMSIHVFPDQRSVGIFSEIRAKLVEMSAQNTADANLPCLIPVSDSNCKAPAI